jgi:hypothetical protein
MQGKKNLNPSVASWNGQSGSAWKSLPALAVLFLPVPDSRPGCNRAAASD